MRVLPCEAGSETDSGNRELLQKAVPADCNNRGPSFACEFSLAQARFGPDGASVQPESVVRVDA